MMPPEHLRIIVDVLGEHTSGGCQEECLQLAKQLVRELKRHGYRIQKVKYEDVETGDD